MTFVHLTLSKPAGRKILSVNQSQETSQRVFYLQDNLSFGPLPADVDNFYPRYQWLENFYGEFSHESQDIIFYSNLKILHEIEDRLRHSGTRALIWAEKSASDQTWLRFLSRFFPDWDMIYVAYMEHSDPSADMENKFAAELYLDQWQEEYDALVKDRSLLRLWENESITSLPLSAFDAELLKYSEPETCIAAFPQLASGFVKGRMRQLNG